ncbi:MAG: hypothetical protein R3C53_01930 [Pirellulaceae bacterium]
MAQESDKKGKKGKGDPVEQMVNNFVKSLEAAELTEDQTKEIKELYTKTAKEVVALRKEAEIPGNIFKKRAEASKEAKGSGKKGEELEAAINEKLGLNEKQVKAWKESMEMVGKAKLAVGKLLKKEQLEKIEGPLLKALTGTAGQKKPKKKAA